MMTESLVETTSGSPVELDFSAIWTACVGAIGVERLTVGAERVTPGLDRALEQAAAALDRVLGENDRRIDGFLDWAQGAPLSPLHNALIARYCFEKNRAQKGLVFANSAFAAHPTELSIADLVEKFQRIIFGDLRAANSEVAFCRKPFEHFEIDPDGHVYLCCGQWLPKSIGNVHTQKWDEIWNSAAAQEIRESMHDGSFRHCSSVLCPLIASKTLKSASAHREDPVWRE